MQNEAHSPWTSHLHFWPPSLQPINFQLLSALGLLRMGQNIREMKNNGHENRNSYLNQCFIFAKLFQQIILLNYFLKHYFKHKHAEISPEWLLGIFQMLPCYHSKKLVWKTGSARSGIVTLLLQISLGTCICEDILELSQLLGNCTIAVILPI